VDTSPPDFDVQDGNDQPPPRARPWVGYWRVRRYGGEDPPVPTFYDATEERWDVIKGGQRGLHVARHPILEIKGEAVEGEAVEGEAVKGDAVEGDILVLKDEGTADEAAETWRVEVAGERLYVEARTGPHEGAVGVADRIEADPRELVSEG